MMVQTIPTINEMTAAQQIELTEAIWKNMSERSERIDPPNWHSQFLEDRQQALAEGRDSFIGLDEFEADLRREMK